MKTYVNLGEYIVELFSDCQTLPAKFVDKIKKKYNLFSVHFFPKIVLVEIMWKYMVELDRLQTII